MAGTGQLTGSPVEVSRAQGSLTGVAEDALVPALRNSLPFRYLDEDQLVLLAGAGRVTTFDKGSVICRIGEESNGLHVVLAGRIRVSRPGPGGHDVNLGERGPGGSFGEPSLLDSGTRSATVVATERSRLFVLARRAFLASISASPEFAERLLAGIGAELRQAQERIFDDVVHEHALQAQMHAERYRSLAQLVAGVAHEVNTPLGIINTAASVLADDLAAIAGDAGPIAEPIRDALVAAELISSNLARTSRLVERFKSLSAASAAAAVEAVELMSVIDGVLALFAPTARSARLTVEARDVRADPSCLWIGDAGYLAEVVLNLLSNVGRHAYPPTEGGPVEIILLDDDRPDGTPGFQILVRDHGRGVVAEHLDRVWEPFFTTGRARGGTGLGLSVVNNLVTEGMFGTAEIDSVPGEQTTVRLRFPQRPPLPDR